jgi:ketosteroid isomerase-like protein
MIKLTFRSILLLIFLIVSVSITSCKQITTENNTQTDQIDLASFEKEIELRLREYENLLQKGDSIALGDMYMVDAQIIPSTIGRENIIKSFGRMIRDSVTGRFKTTDLWGNDYLLVEEGTGVWYQGKGLVVGRGKYLLVWKKDDGKWKILRDTWFPEEMN